MDKEFFSRVGFRRNVSLLCLFGLCLLPHVQVCYGGDSHKKRVSETRQEFLSRAESARSELLGLRDTFPELFLDEPSLKQALDDALLNLLHVDDHPAWKGLADRTAKARRLAEEQVNLYVDTHGESLVRRVRRRLVDLNAKEGHKTTQAVFR